MSSIEDIKYLRTLTGISIGECKKALEEAGGDVAKAKEILKQWGKEVAEKKQGREVGAGLIASYIHGQGSIGTLVEVRCETDFVARSEDFQRLCKEIAMQVASMNPASVDDLLLQPSIKNASQSVRGLIEETIGKLGENIRVVQFSRFAISS